MKDETILIELLTAIKSISSMETGHKRLVILLGQLGDFDSFEYCQTLVSNLDQFLISNTHLCIIAIGNDESKTSFCQFTGLPEEYLYVVDDNTLHKKLGVDVGLSVTGNSYVNLFLMCLGIGSPGTLKEVLRGYTGDSNASSIFKKDQRLMVINKIQINTSFFENIFGTGFLRPFELATRRLLNMEEILCNWHKYMPVKSLITQRNATFLLDHKDNLLLSYYSKGLLDYTPNKSKPLDFLF